MSDPAAPLRLTVPTEANRELFRKGVWLQIPAWKTLPRPWIVGFDADEGVGDLDGQKIQHALLVLTTDLVWRDHKRHVNVQAGIVIDGASVPPQASLVIDPNAHDVDLPGAGHDGLYRDGFVLRDPVTGDPIPFDRSDADKIYAKMCEDMGCDAGDVRKMWLALKMFGGSSYQKKPLDWRPELVPNHDWSEFR